MVKHEYITRLTVVDRDNGRLLELWDLKDVELSYQDSDGKNMRTLKVFISQSSPKLCPHGTTSKACIEHYELQSESKKDFEPSVGFHTTSLKDLDRS